MSTDESTQHPYLAGRARPRIIAHRGFVSSELAAIGVAENTRAAFTAALAAGADCLETDCRLTRDGVVVLAHDADLTRVANDSRAIAQVDLAELDEIFAARGGLLTLERALTEFPRAHWNVDVKSRAVAAPLGRAVAPHGARVLVTSFSDAYRRAALAAAAAEPRATLPATSPGKRALVRVLLAVASGAPRVIERAFAGLDALQIPERHGRFRVLTPRLIAAARAHGVEVHVWTVNDGQRMRELLAMGVDGVVTDRTDVAVAALRSR
ncbi:glycerophosphodiester phosphodiesterase family protein [Leucobacter manosquensis]|uniref:Glycerophosphodiester phosphodiesterase n=1 Tax=Leucobacter manosquensis TaxID=2810611 RepID=A0ABS5M3F0_9MICO|nr:glycerophosphodiester phosphodiesterase family protein [Leucobacter manosquensis]MBS3181505.1 glycerophosphodiester phosphodiesterase [Leucobacter manosquensis]